MKQAMVLAITSTVASALPLFLTGALAVQLTEELVFGSVGLGAAVAAFRGSGAVLSPLLGRLADRLGAVRAIRLSTILVITAALGIAGSTRWAMLTIGMMVGGAANALAQPAANRLLSNVFPRDRLGTAFGLKQSAPPAAAMLAGVSVPAVAATIGWRWAFVLTALFAAAPALIGKPPQKQTPGTRASGVLPALSNRRLLVLLAVAFGLGNATSSSVTAFYVASAVSAGSTPQFAGIMLSVGSVAAISSRILCGVIADRLSSYHLRISAGLLTIGAIGIAFLAQGSPKIMAIGVPIALAGSWGFNGVFWFSLIRAYPEAPGRVSGAVFPGGLVGGTMGPILFGVVVDGSGYQVAWPLIAALSLVAASAMFYAAQRLK